MWSSAWQQIGEVVWLMSMLTGLSLVSLGVAAAAVVIVQ
jgi:hypothetical protein